MLSRKKIIRAICAASLVTVAPHFTNSAEAAFHGSAPAPSGFNNGKFQLNFNFPQYGGDYPFIDWAKNLQTWSWGDNSGSPIPTDLDINGYPKPGTSTLTAHGGVYGVFNIPAEANIGGNCPNGIIGTCWAHRLTGKGTPKNLGTIISATASSVVSTGAVVTVNFSAAQDFRAGMEVPLSGTTGLTASNGGGGPIASGGTSGAWTVCAAGLTATSIQLCLNDGVTNLTTTTAGTATGTTTVRYGRFPIGVATKGRVVTAVTGSPLSINLGISAQDATTPISAYALVLEGPEETLWEQGKTFRPKFLNTLLAGPGLPAVLRNLDPMNMNISTEVRWADRKPVTYYSWSSMEFDIPSGSIFAGTTSSGTSNDYAVSLGSGAPTDRTRIIVQFDATAVTSSAAGTASAAILTFPSAHPLKVTDPINLFTSFGGTTPTAVSTFTGQISGTTLTIQSGIAGGIVLGMNATGAGVTAFQITGQNSGTPGGAGQYAISGSAQTVGPVTMNASVALPLYGGFSGGQAVPYYVVATTATTVSYSYFPGGLAISTSNAGSGTLYAHKTVVATNVTFPTSGPNITWSNHNTNVNDPIACTGTLPSPLVFPGNYFIKTVIDANTVTIAATPGGAAINFSASGSNTQCLRQPTLSLNGTTAVPIKDQFGKPIQFGENPLAFLSGSGNGYGILVYDAVLGAWLKTGSDYNNGSVFMVNAWPPEIFLELCKEVGAMPWMVSGRFMLEGATGLTDYMPSLMALIKYQWPSWMVVRFEIENETWNYGFIGTNLAYAHTLVYSTSNLPNYAGWPTGDAFNNYAGKEFSLLGQAANAIYGGAVDGTKYQVVVGVQTGDFATSNGLGDAARVTSANYVSQTTAAPPSLTGPWAAGGGSLTINYVKDPGYKWGTHVASAQYFETGYDSSSSLSIMTSLASSFAAGSAIVTINNGTPNVAGTTLTVVSDSVGRLDSGSSQLYGAGIPYGTSVTGTYPNFTTSNPALLANSGQVNLSFVQSTSVASAVTQWVDSFNYDATFTGAISGNQLTTTGTTGYILPGASSVGGVLVFQGDVLAPASGIPNYTRISNQISGTPNGDGVYQLSASLASQGPVTMHTSGIFGLPSVSVAYGAVAAFANGTAQTGGGWGGGTYHLHMTGYEGGYSPSVTSGQLLALWQYGKYVTSTPNAANGLETYVTQNCVNFKAAGGDYCSLFQFTGLPVNTSPWDALDDIYQPGPTPYWSGYLNLP